MQGLFSWFWGTLVFFGALSALAFIAYHKDAPDGSAQAGFLQYLPGYLKKNWKRILPGVLICLIAGYEAGLLVLLAAYWFTWALGRKGKIRQTRSVDALAKLGGTPEERSAKIDELFDTKTENISFALPELGAEAQVLRALSAMPAREREPLRIAYHLYNLGMQHLNNFDIARFGLVYADGKGFLVGQSKRYGQPAAEYLQQIQGEYNPEACINIVLDNLMSALRKNPDDPTLKKLRSRVHGDGGDLEPDVPLKALAKGTPNGSAVVLGRDDKDVEKLWCYDGEGSMITVAPPGSGKTQCHVFPNLLAWHGPAVILDVKGEIYVGTSKWRQKNVGPVYKFSPLDPAKSHCYNPLSLVRAEPDYLWEDSRFLADMMIVPSNASDPFWESKARDVLTAAISHVCYSGDPDTRPMFRIIDIVHGGKAWKDMIAGLQSAVDVRAMVQQGTSLAEMNEKTRDSVLQTAQASLSAWSGERIGRATRKSDWSPLDLRSGKSPTIYICLRPNEVDGYISVLRVFIAQHIRVLTSELPPRDAHPILFLLDELPRLRQMRPVEEALEIGRQYGIRLWMFTQSLGQLENSYPNAEGMVGSCALRMFMNPSLHDETAQKLSEDIGYRESVIDGTRVKIVEPNILAGPEFKNHVIVMAAGAKPARLRKHFAYQDEVIKARMGSL